MTEPDNRQAFVVAGPALPMTLRELAIADSDQLGDLRLRPAKPEELTMQTKEEG